MSIPFMKEPDTEAFEELPARAVSPYRNLVTPEGLAQIETEMARMQAEFQQAQKANDRVAIARASRDLRYWSVRRTSAELVPPMATTDVVHFGNTVTILREDGRKLRYRIVGEDEADPVKGMISHASPLARALIGKRIGEVVAAGQGEAEIAAIE